MITTAVEDPKSPPSTISLIRKKMKRNSLIGGIIMTALAIAFAFLSYFTKSFVLEADSIISFVAALLLFTTEQSDTVQKRVVERVLSSFDKIMLELTHSDLDNSRLVFVPMTKNIENVVTLLEPKALESGKDPINPLAFTPLGRELAELALREIGQSNPSVETVLDSLPHLVTGELALATGLQIKPLSEDRYEFTFNKPLILDGNLNERKRPITSITSSLVGVLLAHSSSRNVEIEEYSLDTSHGNEKFVARIVNKGAE